MNCPRFTLSVSRSFSGAFFTVLVLLTASTILPAASVATEYRVSSAAQITAALTTAQPGDTLTMTNGTWMNALILFKGAGTADAPLLLRAETYGGVVLSGKSYLRIGGKHLVVDGLLFRKGESPSGAVVEFRGSGGESDSCRMTNCAIVDYSPADSTIDNKWVSLYGTHNRVDHCYFKGKKNLGTTLVVWLSAKPNYHRIDHNYFAGRPLLYGWNGGETIRVGTSDWSMYDSFTTVEYNLFEECNGEIEIISNKSCENIYRYNTFLDCQGTLTLRHGNRCTVEGNFFFGNHVRNSGGIRIIGEDHKVFNNYISGTSGSGLSSALTIMNGVPNSPANRYFQVKRAVVAFNTLVDNVHPLNIGGGKDSEISLPPLDCVVANNLVVGTVSPLITLTDIPINMTWQGNIFYGATLGMSQTSGVMIVDPLLKLSPDGMWRPDLASPAINASAGSFPSVATDMDGQVRDAQPDIGADELSGSPGVIRPLTPGDVGPPQQLLTGIVDAGTTSPHSAADFWLRANFPNPFNPTTAISFSLSSRSFVTLIVYDALGREVAVLRSEELAAGDHMQRWNAASMPSGAYFYRLKAGETAETRKMILLR